MAKKMEDKDVFPGAELAVIEVFQKGVGAYQLHGDVRSAELGRAHYDLIDRRVKVEKKTRDLILPLEGSDVMA